MIPGALLTYKMTQEERTQCYSSGWFFYLHMNFRPVGFLSYFSLVEGGVCLPCLEG